MRALDEAETTAVFQKLLKFTGSNLKNIVERPSHEGPDKTPGRYCFRLQGSKVYYVSESLVRRATNISKANLVALGSLIGNFTHNAGDFHLTIQSLDMLSANAKHKVWLKPTSEMAFLYGNHVLKGGLGRITENVEAGDGVIVVSMSDVPLGFGIAARRTQECRKMDPNGVVVLHQADIGQYLRDEDVAEKRNLREKDLRKKKGGAPGNEPLSGEAKNSGDGGGKKKRSRDEEVSKKKHSRGG